MPHSRSKTRGPRPHVRQPDAELRGGPETRYTVGLPPPLASQVKQYAQTVDVSMSRAIAALVRLGLENQADRKREFFERLKKNLANDDPKDQDRLLDEFRTLILGR